MNDALTRAFEAADRMTVNCKSAASIPAVMQASAGYNNRPLSLSAAREQMLHFRGWVWSAVRLVAQRVAGQCVYTGLRAGGTTRAAKSIGERVEPMDNHALLDALADPNPWMSYWQTMFCTVASVEVTGRGLWWVTDGIDGRTGKGIMFLPSAWIIEIDPLQRWWKIRPTYSTQDFTIPGEEIVNFHYPSPEGNSPNEVISPLSRVSEAVLTDQQIQTAQHSAFKNGIFPKVVLTAGRLPGVNGLPGERPTFTPQQRADLIATIKTAYQGVINADEPIILDSLIEKIEKFSQTIQEMDFIGSSKVTKARVLQAYGVSPILLGELENANRASSTVAEEIFVYAKCNPLIEMLSGTLTQRLAPMFASPRERLVCWIEPAVPHDAENTLKQWDLGSRMGFVTKNEYRINVLNLPAVDGGDEFMEPIGFLPADSANNNDGNDNKPDKPDKRLNGHANRITITAN